MIRDTRRVFLQHSGLALPGLALTAVGSASAETAKTSRFELSLHQYSLKRLFDGGKLDLLTYAKFAKETLGLSNIEFAAEFCGELLKSPDKAKAIRERSKRYGVTNRVLLCAADHPIDVGSTTKRAKAVAMHIKWAKVAERLGCESMRVRVSTKGNRREQLAYAVAGIGEVCDALKSSPVSVLIENIAGFSRDPAWLAEVVERVGPRRVGLIADFGNFEGDIYAGMQRILPFAKSICTKSWEFDKLGNETKIDFKRMMRVIKASEFRGCIAIEYLGKHPVSGIQSTARLIERYS